MAKASGTDVTVDGRLIKLTNLDKVLYPETGTTKADVHRLLRRGRRDDAAAPARSGRRPASAGRTGSGPASGGKPPTVFFNKDLAKGTPDWVARRKIAHRITTTTTRWSTTWRP